MAIYNEIGTGGVIIAGCTTVEVLTSYVPRFGPTDIAYVLAEANLGYLQKVAIKKALIAEPAGIVTYIDTFNALWNADELVDFITAQAAAINYLTIRVGQVKNFDTCA